MKNIFDGIKVIDFTMNTAGPYGTAMLADFGADVIKVEKPGGDDQRHYAPQKDGVAVGFLWPNRGKRSVVINLGDPDGVTIARALIKDADVVVESFKPGTLAKFGLSYDEVVTDNPGIIYCSVSAYGQTGPMASLPGYDSIAQAQSGVMDLTGEPDGPPTRVGIVFADEVAGSFAFGAISAALFQRERTGKGQYIDIALLDSVVALNPYVEHAAAGNRITRSGNNPRTLAPFGVFEGNDNNYVVICAPAPKMWAKLCAAMERPDLVEDERFNPMANRIKNLDDMIEIIEAWLRSFENFDDAIKVLDGAGIPHGKILSTTDLFDSEQLRVRDMIVDTEMPMGSKTKMKGNPIKFSNAEPILGRAPSLAQHQDEILADAGLSSEEIADIRERWKI